MVLAAGPERAAVLATAWFPGQSAEVGQAREFVRGVLGESWPALDDVLLLVSEIASNAVRHTASAGDGGWFDLTISVADDTIRVAIADQGSPNQPCLAGEGDPSELTGGRGLRIVDAFADRWGHTGDEAGRVVWFEISRKAEQ
jgi:anti-sigma regulatory factor (Ser/Thr protein kinase)